MPAPEMRNFLGYYFLGTAAYGAIRKTVQVWNATTTSYNVSYSDDPKPMPLGDKLGLVVGSAILAPYISPIWMRNDINYIDIKCRGLDHKKYFGEDRDSSSLDYLFK